LDEGARYALIVNGDNLGATLDPALLGYFSSHRLPFMMEVAQRTPTDMKGGHLARNTNGSLILREIAQCPEEDLAAFQDIEKYRYFNVNSLWINLQALGCAGATKSRDPPAADPKPQNPGSTECGQPVCLPG
jgi:UTP--glucose-1-phosphate uridylyltransferase